MKYIASMMFVVFCVSSNANDCRPSEDYLEGLALGYLGLIEKAIENEISLDEQTPIIIWWVGNGRDDYDYEEEESFGKYFGVSELSSNGMFSDAQKVLREKDIGVYILVWIDKIVDQGNPVSVIKTSIGVSGWDMAYDAAVVSADTTKPGWELGCTLNLLN